MAIEYTVRMTEEDGYPVAWIDQNGQVCIKQPHAPGQTEPWSSADEAKAWADQHIQELIAANSKADENAAAAIAQQNALIAQAQADSQKLSDLHDMVTAIHAQVIGNK